MLRSVGPFPIIPAGPNGEAENMFGLAPAYMLVWLETPRGENA